ncbi:MAG: dipeptidase [Phycisphaeraceae bacterium]
MLDKVLDHLRHDHEAAIDRLCDFLRIPSVSTDPAYAEHCLKATDWVVDQLRACGGEVSIHETPRHPLVIAHFEGGNPDAPRALFYGHYDVQPPDPLEKWTTPPFEPTIRDGKLYARGSSDDKGQVMCFIEALRAWHDIAGKPPVPVTVFIEGEEECGSVSLDAFIEKHRDLLKADVAVVSDTAMWGPDQPAITYGLRGLLYFDVKLHGPGRDLHSGVYGGSVPNPCTQLARVLGKLFNEDNAVDIEGFYDDVAPLTEDERRRWANLNFSDDAWAQSIGLTDGKDLSGEIGFSTLERRWARPSCDVCGLYGGYSGEGAKTVIPSFAGAKVSFRLAATQDPNRISDLFRDFLKANTPAGCRWEIEEFGRARPVVIPIDSPWIAAAQQAVETGCGREAVLNREGATIPVVATFKELLGLDTLLIGFGLHDDNLHSPNEKFELNNFRMGCLTHASLLAKLAG